MIEVIDEASPSELPRVLHKNSWRLSWILALVVISFGLCAAAAYVWINIDTILARSSAREPALIGLSPEDTEALSEVRSGQQKAVDEIAVLNGNIGAQQAELKRMADRIEALTAKIESLQSSLVAASAAASAPPVPSQPVAHPYLRPARRAVQPSKSEGPISVGGAPLMPEPGASQH
ncbi:hypothetical protein [Bradyrhizobium yuanmingense]|uniref:hypothetical protein n=1 Tax=Bradyrhizobium yuanmingense TaxID=108015 RepID=UPI0023B932E5|nr:hypothetical protein [Bradyrhizobium yuanmingense]MDF0585100.1 hypothetical protein [Bradyrhizobium yuanmingense]